MITVTGLFIYPVKSLGGISLSEADLGPRGFKYDREWLIVDKGHRFVTQREIARMALIKTTIDEERDVLILRLPEVNKELSIPLKASPEKETIKVTVWNDSALATVESDEVNAILSNFLRQELRLVRMAPGYKRRVDEHYAPDDDDIVGFADGFPFLIISDESLDELNERLEYPLPMNRFRPNITTHGGGPFAEDHWDKIQIGTVELALVKPCARCVITTIDQDCAEQGKEPLRTLANYRNQGGKILFGQNAIFKGSGNISVGDSVTVM